MNKELVEFIKELSAKDTKSLGQKALKACEEVGELAKVILPFEDAFACRHRFVDKQAILEEVADVILTVQSIAYSLDFTNDELEEMIKNKAMYWAELQARDTAAKFPVPFEIHITVENAKVDEFKIVCSELNVKPLLLDLQNNGESILHDLMTSSVHMGNNYSAFEEKCRISKGLENKGFKVIRQKIETVPWHPAAPSEKHINPIMPPNCYFEAHFAIITNKEKLEYLNNLALSLNCHLSKNIFKKIDDNNFKIMATYRKYDGVKERFKYRAEEIRDIILNNGFAVDRLITEFSIYDTKISHDSEWLKKSDNTPK